MSQTKTQTNANRGRAFVVALLLAVLTLPACATGGNEGSPESSSVGETTDAASEETSTREERMVEISRIDSGSSGQGDTQPRAVVAPSLEALSAALGGTPELRGVLRSAQATTATTEDGAYIAVLWGEQNTGGYAVGIESASLEGDTVTVELALQRPPEGAIVAQALTHPYAVAALEGLDLSNKKFVLTDQSGRELSWPVRVSEG